MVKLIKGDAVKWLDEQSGLIAVLKADGWVVEGEKPAAKRGRPAKDKSQDEGDVSDAEVVE